MARTKHDPRSTAEWLAGLAEPTRLTILKVLATGPKTVTDLAKACGTEVVNVSHHLNLMKNVGLVAAERDGRFMWYTLVGANAVGGRLELTHESGLKVTLPLD
jgi:ArsR family transcriptional regulator, nickel/cobalt-responsive transcriptional repressor